MSPAFTLKFNSTDGTGFSLECPDICNSTFSFDFTANKDGTFNHKIKIEENKSKGNYTSASPSSSDTDSTTDVPTTPENDGRGNSPLIYGDGDLTFGSMSREQWEQEFKEMFVAPAVKRKISELEEEEQENLEHEQLEQQQEQQVQDQEHDKEHDQEQVSTTEEEEDEAIYFNGLEGAGNQLEDGTGTLPDIEEDDDHESQGGQVTHYVPPAANEFDIRELDDMF